MIFLDLDDFKTINDSLGHAAGDEVLVEVARRLDANTRGADTAARFGGDEFAILLEDVAGSHEAADTAQRILEMLARPIRAGHREITLRGSLGISVVTRRRSPQRRRADPRRRRRDVHRQARGKGGYRLFEPAMHEGVLARLELRTDLQRAIATDQLELHYQPIVHLADGSVSGVEALLRWRHPERGMVSPAEFIPIAEETGLIIPIGRWVLREGCRHARRLVTAGRRAPRMSINLSLKQIQHSDIVADVRDALAESGLAPERLILEITESVLMDDTDLAVERLRDLKALGVGLALDDFGTGYSSLSYLSRFPVDILKMDRSFLSEGSLARRPQPRHGGRRPRGHARARGGRRGHRAARAVATRSTTSAAASGRASSSRGRWTPRPRSRSWPRQPAGSPVHHSYESLDRAGGVARHGLLAPLRHRDFRLLWVGMCVSLLGDGAFIVALAWQVYAAHRRTDRDGHGRHRHDRPDDRLPADRRRRQRSLRSPPRHDRRRRRALSRRRRPRGLSLTGMLEIWHVIDRSSPSTAPGRRSSLPPSTRSSRICSPSANSPRPTPSTRSSARSRSAWRAPRWAESSSASSAPEPPSRSTPRPSPSPRRRCC